MDTSQYLDIFVDETKEHIQVLSDQIMVLEKEPDNSDAIAEIFRSAHSLKGRQEQWDLRECSILPMTWKMYFLLYVKVK